MAETKMVELSSSNIARAGYDDDTGAMPVEFANGGRYVYAGVPREVFEGLIASLSPGAYLARNIRDRYRFTREG